MDNGIIAEINAKNRLVINNKQDDDYKSIVRDLGLEVESIFMRENSKPKITQKIKLSKVQNAIILSSLIGAIISQYDKKQIEDTPALKDIDDRINIFLEREREKNFSDSLVAIGITDNIWGKMVSKFIGKAYGVSAKYTIILLQSYYARDLNVYANLNEKQFMNLSLLEEADEEDIEEVERHSSEVADFIIDELSVYTSIKRKKKGWLKIAK